MIVWSITTNLEITFINETLITAERYVYLQIQFGVEVLPHVPRNQENIDMNSYPSRLLSKLGKAEPPTLLGDGRGDFDCFIWENPIY